MGNNKRCEPSGLLKELIDEEFGSYDEFKKEFKKKAAPVVDLFKESEPLTYSLVDKLKGIKIA